MAAAIKQTHARRHAHTHTQTYTHTHPTASCISAMDRQHGAYATPAPIVVVRCHRPSSVVVNSAKLFATLSRKMLNFVDGDELKLETQILKTARRAATTTRYELARTELRQRQPSSKGLSSLQSMRRDRPGRAPKKVGATQTLRNNFA